MEQKFTQQQVQIQKQVQVQNLTPQQLLLVKLTEMSVNELEERVEKELLENSALEESNVTDTEDKATEEDTNVIFSEEKDEEDMSGRDSEYDERRNDYATEDDTPDYLLQSAYNSEEPAYVSFGMQESFYENLKNQIGEHDVTDRQREILEYLIGSLDSDGLLRKSLDSIYYELAINEGIDTSVEELKEVLTILQSFEPVGIAATSLQECLAIQLRHIEKPSENVIIAQRIVDKHFDDFINKRYDRLRQLCRLDNVQFDEVLHILQHLNPRPGSGLSDTTGDNNQTVIPDFTVRQDENGSFEILLNQGEVPVLHVSSSYKESLAEYEQNKKNMSRQQKDTALYLRQKIEAAQNFINAIAQRQDTMMRTMKAIVNLQRAFFEEGDSSLLQPMILEDVAKATGLDKSTISRVTKSKYVQTDFGIFPLKFFFNEKFTTSGGENLSKMQIKGKLREIIEAENKKKPLSDDDIADMLNQAGFPVARRTVAKYREKMNIPVARLRRQ